MTVALKERIAGGIAGLVVGDALGVPVEFVPREQLRKKPVRGMTGYGTHQQPAGTWSDDSSMALATAESLLNGYDPVDVMKRFQDWLTNGFMTPHGKVFDIGFTTQNAIRRAGAGIPAISCGGTDETENGNGSLMRILPLSIYVHRLETDEIIEKSFEISGLTHAHVRSRLCCAYFSLVVRGILNGNELKSAMEAASHEIGPKIPPDEELDFQPIIDCSLLDRAEEQISSSGYVMHTLQAALWCCQHHADFKSAVLAAVNLGGDADTTGAVAGGLAGIIHGIGAIPREWINQLAKRDEVLKVASDLASLMGVQNEHGSVAG